MTRILSIYGYNNYDYAIELDGIDMWEGKILVDEYGWFKGLVRDEHDHTRVSMVYGIVLEDQTIELFKEDITNGNMPIVYHADHNEKGYEGIAEKLNIFLMQPFGTSKIRIREFKKDIEKSKLELKKQLTKALTDEENRPLFYDEYYENEDFRDVVIQEYNKRRPKKLTLELCRKELN